MNLYTKLFISIFIVFPYFIFTTEFYSEFKELISKIFHKDPNQLVFNIIFSFYFILYFISLIFGFCEFIVFDIISGLFTLNSAFIFYKPFTEKDKYLDYFPHLEVIYVSFLGIYFIIHGILLIINKIKNKNYFVHLNDNNIIVNDINLLSGLEIQKNNIKLNNISFEINKTSLRELFFYFLIQKLYKFSKKKCYVTNFTKNDFNIDFEDKYIIISISAITIKYKNEFINLKNFRGKVNFVGKEIKITILEKGTISHEISFFKNVFLKGFYNLFKGIAVDKMENKINKKIKNGIHFKKEIFDFNILIEEFSVINDILKINFNTSIDFNN